MNSLTKVIINIFTIQYKQRNSTWRNGDQWFEKQFLSFQV